MYPTALVIATAVAKSYLERTIQHDNMPTPQATRNGTRYNDRVDSSVVMSTPDTRGRDHFMDSAIIELEVASNIDIERSLENDADIIVIDKPAPRSS